MNKEKSFTNNLYEQLLEELELYSEMGVVPVRKLAGALHCLRDAVSKLRVFLLEHGFESDAEEIAFFKEDKPRFVCEQVFLVELATVQLGRTVHEQEPLAAYYAGELRRVRVFFSRHAFLHRYYLMGASDLDAVLFLRGAGRSEMLLPEAPDTDPALFTNGGFLWAQFMAFERLQEWLEEEIRRLGIGDAGVGRADGGDGGPSLTWTGETINLVELAYGIWLTGQVNNGQVSISQIVEWLEAHFGVRIGKAHRRWQSIAGRKRLAPFKFIEEVRVALEKRLEEEMGR